MTHMRDMINMTTVKNNRRDERSEKSSKVWTVHSATLLALPLAGVPTRDYTLYTAVGNSQSFCGCTCRTGHEHLFSSFYSCTASASEA